MANKNPPNLPRNENGQFVSPKQLAEDMQMIDPSEYEAKLKDYADGIRKQSRLNDFQNYYKPTDDIYGSGGSGTGDRPSFEEMRSVAQRRLGVGWRATKMVAGDVVRNQFKFVDYRDKKVEKPEIFKWMMKSDFFNQLEDLLYYERTYGVAFLVKYYSSNDDLSTKPPNKPPKKFQALPPVYLSPTNLWDTNMLDYEQEEWEFTGGLLNSQTIHKDRIYVLTTRPVAGSWRGISVFEPIWLPLMCYFQALIYLTKGIAKWGNAVPILKMGDSEVNKKAFDEWLDLMIEYQANYFYLIGKEDDLQFANAKLGQGMTEYIEFLKEDISSGVGITLNFLFGRSVSGGIGGEGALTSERNYMQTLANVQRSISDDVLAIVRDSRFDVEGLQVSWNLALQKTSEQRLREERLEIQNDIMREQLKQMKEQNRMLKTQRQQLEQNQQLITSMDEQYEQTGEVNVQKALADFDVLNTQNIQKLKEIGAWNE